MPRRGQSGEIAAHREEPFFDERVNRERQIAVARRPMSSQRDERQSDVLRRVKKREPIE